VRGRLLPTPGATPCTVSEEYSEMSEPTKLDKSLVGKIILQKWNECGWCMGKVSHFFQRGVHIPGQTERGNYSIKWVEDNGRGVRDTKLRLDQYGGGDDRAVGAWVLLKRN
jgi:hypothetical protein